MYVKPIPFAEPYEERIVTFTSRKGLIYVIQNIIDGRCYVGQTVQTFTKRYRMGLWWEHTENKALQEDVQRYGAGMFRLRIVEHSKTQEELNVLERQYAERLNAYLPHGYNKQRCGVVRQKRKALSEFGPVELNDPNGNDVVVTDLAALCEAYQMLPALLRKLVEGKISYCKRWTAKGNTNKTDPRKRQCVLYDAQGNVYHVHDGLKAFCDARQLNTHLMACMVNGATYTSQGYALSPEAFSKRKSKWVVTLTRNGEDVTIDSIVDSKRLVGFSPHFVYRLVKRQIKEHEGWMVKDLRVAPTRH